MKRYSDPSITVIKRAPPDKAAFVRRALETRGSFLGINGDAFHRAAQALAASDPTLELVDQPQPLGKRTIDGWLLRTRSP